VVSGSKTVPALEHFGPVFFRAGRHRTGRGRHAPATRALARILAALLCDATVRCPRPSSALASRLARRSAREHTAMSAPRAAPRPPMRHGPF